MVSFSIDKQRDKMNAEWMSRPVDSDKNKTKNQPLVLVLTSMEQALTFAYRLKRKLLNGPILGGAYIIIWNMITKKIPYKTDTQYEFLDQKRKRKVLEMKKLIHKFDITPDDLGLQLNINNL